MLDGWYVYPPETPIVLQAQEGDLPDRPAPASGIACVLRDEDFGVWPIPMLESSPCMDVGLPSCSAAPYDMASNVKMKRT